MRNKNNLTGPTNCKKTTRHHAHLSCKKSRKTNDAKLSKWSKTSIWAIFLTISRSNNFKLQIFLKNRFLSNWRSYLVLTSGQKQKKSLDPDFGLIWGTFCEYLQIKYFFKNPALWLLYLYSPLTLWKKSEKSLELFLRKLRYQSTNQPIITDFGLIWRPFCKYFQIKNLFQKSGSVTFLPL